MLFRSVPGLIDGAYAASVPPSPDLNPLGVEVYLPHHANKVAVRLNAVAAWGFEAGPQDLADLLGERLERAQIFPWL